MSTDSNSASVEDRSAHLWHLVRSVHHFPRLLSLRILLHLAPFGAAAIAGWSIVRYRITIGVLGGTAATIAGISWALGTSFDLRLLLPLWGGALVLFAAARTRPLTRLLLRLFRFKPLLPDIQRLERQDASELISMVDELFEAAGVPPVAGILVNGDISASIVTVDAGPWPYLRIPYLLVGYPLLATLSPEQLQAILLQMVIQFHGTAPKVRLMVERLLEATGALVRISLEHRRERLLALAVWLDDRTRGQLTSYRFALGFTNVVQADRKTAESVGSKALAEALCGVHLLGEFAEREWFPRVRAGLIRPAAADENPFAELGPHFRRIDRQAAKLWLAEAALKETMNDVGLPPYGERVRGMGEVVAPPAPTPHQAIELVERSCHTAILDRLGSEWRQFAERLARIEQVERWYERRLLADLLHLRQEAGELEPDEWARLAGTFSRTGDVHRAEREYRALLRRHPDHAQAAFQLGQLLVAKKDPRGIELLDQAVAADAARCLPDAFDAVARMHRIGCLGEAARSFLDRHEVAFRALAVENARTASLADQERAVLSNRTRYLAHDLHEIDLRILAEKLERSEGVAGAWLVRKDLKYHAEFACYVLGVQFADGVEDRRGGEAKAARIAQELSWLGDVVGFNVDAPGKARIAGNVLAVEGSRVWPPDRGTRSPEPLPRASESIRSHEEAVSAEPEPADTQTSW